MLTDDIICQSYMLPFSSENSSIEADEMRAVTTLTLLPDIFPRSLDEIQRMKKLYRDVGTEMKYVPPRLDVPAPYVNDDECDEFEDATINTEIDNFFMLRRREKFCLNGPSVDGELSAVFEAGMLYKIITDDGSWFFYNDTEKYEMHVHFSFGLKSELQPGENVEMFVESDEGIEVLLIVYPQETLKLVSGKVNGFKCMTRAVPLNDEKRVELFSKRRKKVVDDLKSIADGLGVDNVLALEERQILQYCVDKGIPYIDCKFFPSEDSLYRSGVDKYKLRGLPWVRPKEYIPPEQLQEVRLFRRTILPSQVTQGEIGDSYLISAMACLAESAVRVRNLFRHPVSAASGKIERAVGAYWVTLNYNGWWCPILIDDYLPGYLEGPEFARCAVDLRRLWVGLLEKAYAKAYRSYSDIASGDPLEPLHDFTGFPITRFDTTWEAAVNGDDELFGRLIYYDKNGFITMLFTPRNDTAVNRFLDDSSLDNGFQIDLEERYKRRGLQLHCGYTVLRVKYFKEIDLRLLQIRNPWGTSEQWNGGWSRHDERWEKYPSVKEACDHDSRDNVEPDNIFWMEWSDVLENFIGGGVCHVQKNWYDYRIRGEFCGGYPSVCLEVNVTDPIHAYIELSQEDERSDENSAYAAMLICVSCHNGKLEKVDCTSNVDVERPDCQLRFNFARDVALRYVFRPEGNPYFVIPRIHEATVLKPYVLGLLIDTYVGNGIRVEFKTVDKVCKVFHNMPSFKVRGLLKDISTEYQVRTSRQPICGVGVELKDKRLKQFGLYFD